MGQMEHIGHIGQMRHIGPIIYSLIVFIKIDTINQNQALA